MSLSGLADCFIFQRAEETKDIGSPRSDPNREEELLKKEKALGTLRPSDCIILRFKLLQ